MISWFCNLCRVCEVHDRYVCGTVHVQTRQIHSPIIYIPASDAIATCNTSFSCVGPRRSRAHERSCSNSDRKCQLRGSMYIYVTTAQEVTTASAPPPGKSNSTCVPSSCTGTPVYHDNQGMTNSLERHLPHMHPLSRMMRSTSGWMLCWMLETYQSTDNEQKCTLMPSLQKVACMVFFKV